MIQKAVKDLQATYTLNVQEMLSITWNKIDHINKTLE